MKRLLFLFFLIPSLAFADCEVTVNGVCVESTAINQFIGLGVAPPLSTTGTAVQYFDTASGKLKISENGGAFSNIGVGGSATVDESANYDWTGEHTFVNVTFSNDFTLSDNTAGKIVVADGTKFTPVAVSGDCTIDSTGDMTCSADSGDITDVGDCSSGSCQTVTWSGVQSFTDIAVSGVATIANLSTGTGVTGVIATDSNNNLYINPGTGNVGIGDSTPSVKLDVAGDVAIQGDDLFMATNTAGYMLVADGTNYNPVAISGDITIDGTGNVTIDRAGILMSKSFTVLNPNAAYDIDTEILIWDNVDADLTFNNVSVSCNGTTDITADLKWTNSFVTLDVGSDTTINSLDTTSGVLDDSSISAGSVSAGKDVYMTWDAQPDAGITQVGITLEYNYD